jgi:hypothetical protein
MPGARQTLKSRLFPAGRSKPCAQLRPGSEPQLGSTQLRAGPSIAVPQYQQPEHNAHYSSKVPRTVPAGSFNSLQRQPSAIYLLVPSGKVQQSWRSSVPSILSKAQTGFCAGAFRDETATKGSHASIHLQVTRKESCTDTTAKICDMQRVCHASHDALCCQQLQSTRTGCQRTHAQSARKSCRDNHHQH